MLYKYRCLKPSLQDYNERGKATGRDRERPVSNYRPTSNYLYHSLTSNYLWSPTGKVTYVVGQIMTSQKTSMSSPFVPMDITLHDKNLELCRDNQGYWGGKMILDHPSGCKMPSYVPLKEGGGQDTEEGIAMWFWNGKMEGCLSHSAFPVLSLQW